MPNTVRALIIVHGMGSQERNSTLLGTVRPMRELMEARGRQTDVDNLKIAGDLSPDRHASVDITTMTKHCVLSSTGGQRSSSHHPLLKSPNGSV